MLDYIYITLARNPTKLKPAEIIDSWKGLLHGLKMTQHTVTGHDMTIRREDNEVDCFSSISLLHYLPNETGHDKTANGWKVDKMKLIVTVIEGNIDIPRLAQLKAKAIR